MHEESKNIPYAGQDDKLRTLDIYLRPMPKIFVSFWIHGVVAGVDRTT